MKNQSGEFKSFHDLLKFKNEEEKIRHDATMISFQFISELNKILEDQEITKKKLASDINISPSYITQLFTGDKLVNCEILAKFQKTLGIRYSIVAVDKELAVSGDIEESPKWGEEQINAFMDKFKHSKGTFRYISNVWTKKSNYKFTQLKPVTGSTNKVA
jgi:transcriptional regulator with XRE-family HTH domain